MKVLDEKLLIWKMIKQLVFTMLLMLLVFSNSAGASNPKAGQWKQVGGKIILLGKHKFTKTWSTDGNSWWEGSPWAVGKDRKLTKWDPTVMNSVAVKLGQITVQGPGVVGLFERTKGGASVYMQDQNKNNFRPFLNNLTLTGTGKWDGGVDDFVPGEFWGRIPAGKVTTIDIGAIMAIRNVNIWGLKAYGAPQEVIEAEVWFFPGDGGKVVKVIKNSPPKKATGDGAAKNAVTITVYMPKKGVYQKVNTIVFGPAFPKFKKVRVTGWVLWETLFYKDYAKFQTIKLVLWHNGKPVRKRVTKTDRFGGYSLEMPVNAKGMVGLQTFNKNLTRRLSEGYAPPEYYTTPDENSAGKVDPSLKKKLSTTKDWKNSFWNAASKLKAIQKDYDYQKYGGVGTPNVDQWTKNHQVGRDDINALILFIDLTTAPATATAQIFENANITWKRLTGKPLPFVKSKSKVVKNAMKNGVGFLDYVKRRNKILEAK